MKKQKILMTISFWVLTFLSCSNNQLPGDFFSLELLHSETFSGKHGVGDISLLADAKTISFTMALDAQQCNKTFIISATEVQQLKDIAGNISVTTITPTTTSADSQFTVELHEQASDNVQEFLTPDSCGTDNAPSNGCSVISVSDYCLLQTYFKKMVDKYADTTSCPSQVLDSLLDC
jgi:hypothetical protein